MKTRRILILAGAVVALAAFRPWGHHRGLGHMTPERVERMATERVNDVMDDLEATPAQRARVQEMKGELLKDGRRFHEDGRAARAELLTQWDSDRPDPARVHALVDERVEAARVIGHTLADYYVELHSLLTPEQRIKVSKNVRERMQE
ncbi:MAG: periplasmic heavy metal sensor [Deltaproteobacteria bacterium]|nr:periplasmic heavy metal sensor [Deltaproteobacteria bacterium]